MRLSKRPGTNYNAEPGREPDCYLEADTVPATQACCKIGKKCFAAIKKYQDDANRGNPKPTNYEDIESTTGHGTN